MEVCMRKVWLFFAIAIASLFIGCPVRSLQPLFSEKDIMYSSALVGTWANGEDRYTFKKASDNSYRILLSEQKSTDSVKHTESNGDTMTFVGQLGKLGKSLFLDTYPGREVVDFHLLATHMIFRLWLDADTLRLASLEGDWVKKMIKANRLKIQYTIANGDFILTGSTNELQKIVRPFANDSNAFPNPETFVRVK